MPEIPPHVIEHKPDIARVAMIRALTWAIKRLGRANAGMAALQSLWYRAASSMTDHPERP
jgi:hypothetical protein